MEEMEKVKGVEYIEEVEEGGRVEEEDNEEKRRRYYETLQIIGTFLIRKENGIKVDRCTCGEKLSREK